MTSCKQFGRDFRCLHASRSTPTANSSAHADEAAAHRVDRLHAQADAAGLLRGRSEGAVREVSQRVETQGLAVRGPDVAMADRPAADRRAAGESAPRALIAGAARVREPLLSARVLQRDADRIALQLEITRDSIVADARCPMPPDSESSHAARTDSRAGWQAVARHVPDPSTVVLLRMRPHDAAQRTADPGRRSAVSLPAQPHAPWLRARRIPPCRMRCPACPSRPRRPRSGSPRCGRPASRRR